MFMSVMSAVLITVATIESFMGDAQAATLSVAIAIYAEILSR